MRINFKDRRLITLASVLLALCLTLLPARTLGQIGNDIQLMSWQFGSAPGEKARFTVTNKDDSEQPIRAELTVFDREGNQIAIRETDIPPNGFGYMEVDRDEIPLRGEPTGRLQMLAKVKILVRGRALFFGLSHVSDDIRTASPHSRFA